MSDTATRVDLTHRRELARRWLHHTHCPMPARLCPPDGEHAAHWDGHAVALATSTTIEAFLTALHDATCLPELTGDCDDPAADTAHLRAHPTTWQLLADLTAIPEPLCAAPRVGLPRCRPQRPCHDAHRGQQLGCGRAAPE